MTLGLSFLLAGALQFLCAWLFFRLPGQKFWVVAPIWRAGQFLSPTGVALWVSSVTLLAVGTLSMFVDSAA